MGDTRRQTGAAAEAAAAAFLEHAGLRVIERNVRFVHGEIDLVCRDGDVLVFVEVRLRRRNDFGGAAASIDAAKQAKLVAAAGLYLGRFRTPPACRFDAVLLDALAPARVQWMRSVIEA